MLTNIPVIELPDAKLSMASVAFAYQYAGRKCAIAITVSLKNSLGTNIPQRNAIPSDMTFAHMERICSLWVSLLTRNASDSATHAYTSILSMNIPPLADVISYFISILESAINTTDNTHPVNIIPRTSSLLSLKNLYEEHSILALSFFLLYTCKTGATPIIITQIMTHPR